MIVYKEHGAIYIEYAVEIDDFQFSLAWFLRTRYSSGKFAKTIKMGKNQNLYVHS